MLIHLKTKEIQAWVSRICYQSLLSIICFVFFEMVQTAGVVKMGLSGGGGRLGLQACGAAGACG